MVVSAILVSRATMMLRKRIGGVSFLFFFNPGHSLRRKILLQILQGGGLGLARVNSLVISSAIEGGNCDVAVAVFLAVFFGAAS